MLFAIAHKIGAGICDSEEIQSDSQVTVLLK